MTVIKSGTARTDTGDSDSSLGPYRAELISDSAGLTQFGAFIEELPPGSRSSHTHWHEKEDELVLILSGSVSLIENGTQTELHPRDAACWRAGDPVGHSMYNQTDAPVRYMVIGTRAPADRVTYPNHDRVLILDHSTGTRVYETLDGKPATKPS